MSLVDVPGVCAVVFGVILRVGWVWVVSSAFVLSIAGTIRPHGAVDNHDSFCCEPWVCCGFRCRVFLVVVVVRCRGLGVLLVVVV